MASFNCVTMVGNLVRDPELRYTTAQKAVCTFSIAVNGWQRDAPPDFFPVVAWSNMAELVSRYCKKGSCVLVAGELHSRKYTGRDGVEKQVAEITARDVRFLSLGTGGQGRRAEETQAQPSQGGQNADSRAPADGGAAHVIEEADIPF